MPRYSCALTLAGIIDVDEARVLSDGLNRHRYQNSAQTAFESLLKGKREFIFPADFPEDAGTRELSEPLAQILERFSLSYCFMVLLDGERSITQSRIVDRHLGLSASLYAQGGVYDLDYCADDHPNRMLANRWQDIGACPKLHLIETGHDAMAIAFNPNIETNVKEAYFERQSFSN
tara:strand:- start:180 stop:707 length:528 start_codon:yes stop_codon:yes gene_type:complete